MSKRAEELYPFVLYKVGGWNDIEKVKEENQIRNLERQAYNRAIEDIKELIQSRIKSIGANRERGYWLDAASELQDIIDIIDDE